jgi:hypothetical protein
MNDELSITGNDADGWNIEIAASDSLIVLACLDREHAEELKGCLEKCSWFEVRR